MKMKPLTKKQKIALPAIAVVAAMFAMPFVLPIDVSIDGLEQEFTIEQLTDRTQIIVIGEVVDSKSDVTFKENNPMKPYVWTKTYVKPIKFIKGFDGSDLLEVKTSGGTFNNIKHDSDDPTFQKGGKVLLFLNKEPESVYGDSYYVSGVTQGKYHLINGKAENQNEKRSTVEAVLIDKINNAMKN